MIAALYVATDGPYFNLDGVDPWDEARDARTYAGPWPVVAHPPCERWGRYAEGGPNPLARRREVGDDGGCFACALAAVRTWGGVLEHPEASHAWARFGLTAPPSPGGWVVADFVGGWTCRVEQGRYGHPARKATWLYAHGVELPTLRWGAFPSTGQRLDEGWHSTAERRAARAAGIAPMPRLSMVEKIATPSEFRDLLIGIARTARRTELARTA
jgi:hypothetical protein